MAEAKTNLLRGLAAARANLVPGLVIQLAVLILVCAYYWVPEVRQFLNVIAQWKRQWGFGFSAVAAVAAGAVLPEILRVVIFQGGVVRRRNFSNMLFGGALWAVAGVCIDAFYRGQAFWFGSQPSVTTVLKKVLVDMFGYTPLFGTPFPVLVHEWRNRGFGLVALGSMFSPSFYGEKILPALLTGWALWFPVMTIVYSLPTLLQVPLFSLALTFWSLLLIYLAETSGEAAEAGAAQSA